MFWEHGYDPASIAQLTAAMGIAPPSLYAAFGDKRGLFMEAVERYRATSGAYAERALRTQVTAKAVVESLLLDAAATFTDAAHPRGCLVISAAVNCSPRDAEVSDALAAMRVSNERALCEWIEEDRREGVVPQDVDPAGLARLYATVLEGMSMQARDGATRSDLEAVARDAMRAWPEPPPRP